MSVKFAPRAQRVLQSHELNPLCFQQGAHYTLPNYRRRKYGFGAS